MMQPGRELQAKMKIIGYLISGILTFTAALLVTMGRHIPQFSDTPFKPVMLGVVMFGWAILLNYFLIKSYRGGAASIVGAIMTGVGIWSGLGELFWPEYTTVRLAWTSALASLFFVVAGVTLLMQGHRLHTLHARKIQDTQR